MFRWKCGEKNDIKKKRMQRKNSEASRQNGIELPQQRVQPGNTCIRNRNRRQPRDVETAPEFPVEPRFAIPPASPEVTPSEVRAGKPPPNKMSRRRRRDRQATRRLPNRTPPAGFSRRFPSVPHEKGLNFFFPFSVNHGHPDRIRVLRGNSSVIRFEADVPMALQRFKVWNRSGGTNRPLTRWP